MGFPYNVFSQYTVLEIQFRSVKPTIVTTLPKNFEQLFIPIQAIQGDYSVWMWTTHFKKISNVFILYNYSNCTINQSLFYTCNVKGLEEVEKLAINECTFHR